jgi:hypothetical protein
VNFEKYLDHVSFILNIRNTFYFSLIDMDETVSVPIPTPEVLCGTRSDAENDCSSQIYVRFALRQQLAGSDFVLVLAKQFWALNWD